MIEGPGLTSVGAGARHQADGARDESPAAQPREVSILIVDDVAANLVALEALLARPGYRIVRAHSGQEALRRVLEEEFAVILLDVFMPEIDGFEVAEMLKRRPRSRHTPIIFVTAMGRDEEAIYRGYSAGAVDYLHKPLDPEVVRAKVASLVELYRRNEQIRMEAAALRARERGTEQRPGQLDVAQTQRYRNLAEAIPSIVCVAQPDGAVVSCNRRWFDFTGLSEEHARAWGWLACVHPDDAPAALASWQHAIASGTTVEYECRLRRAQDGAYRWHLARAVPDRNTDGTLTAYLAIITDIDDLKRAQAEAEAERRRAAFLASASAALSSTLDFASALTQVAHLAVPELGDWCLIDLAADDGSVQTVAIAHASAEAQPLAHELIERFPFVPSEPAGVAQVLLTGEPELRTGHADEDPPHAACPARLRAIGAHGYLVVPLRARDRILGTMTFAFTRSQRSHGPGEVLLARELASRAAVAVDNGQLYNEARDAVRTREEFLSIASHELKTPLTSLRLLIQSMLRRVPPGSPRPLGPAEAMSQLQKAERQSIRLTQLIDELFDVSRLMARKFSLNRAPVELGEVVQSVVEGLTPAIEKAGSAVEVKVAPGLLGEWDRSRLEQVVANLLANAIKYGRGRPVVVGARGAGEGVELWVQDDGIGIGAEHLERIFAPFERAVSHSSYGGLGLGLYITRQIVELHGGSIRVESTPNAGSRFVVELPLTAEGDAEAAGDERAG